jgi:hypothetical protein
MDVQLVSSVNVSHRSIVQKAVDESPDELVKKRPLEFESGDKADPGWSRSPDSTEHGDRGLTPEQMLRMAKRAADASQTVEKWGTINYSEDGSASDLDRDMIENMPTPGQKLYLRDFEEAPEGAVTGVGPRGGKFFYYTSGPQHDKWLVQRREHNGLGNVPENKREGHPELAKRGLLDRPQPEPTRSDRPAPGEGPEGFDYPEDVFNPLKPSRYMETGKKYQVRLGMDRNHPGTFAGNMMKFSDGRVAAAIGGNKRAFKTVDDAHDWLVHMTRHAGKMGPQFYRSFDYIRGMTSKAILAVDVGV